MKHYNVKGNLIQMYLEWFNDFITVDKFAEYHSITRKEAVHILNIGRKYHIEETDPERYLSVYPE